MGGDQSSTHLCGSTAAVGYPCCIPGGCQLGASGMLCSPCRSRLLGSCSGLTLAEAMTILNLANVTIAGDPPNELKRIRYKIENVRRNWLTANR